MFNCELCELSFKYQRGRHKHFQSAHLNIRYPCEICGLQFMQKNNLENHMRLHLNERPFKCAQCPKSYVSKKDLKRHIIIHDESLKKRFKCNYCDKKFQDNSTLKTHAKRHTGEHLTHKCDICGRVFGNISHLKRHLLIHTNERNYPCFHDGCNFKCRAPSDLKRHLITHQKNRERYKCQHCDATLATKGNLQAHIYRLHDPNRSKFDCLFCSKKWNAKTHLNQHILFHINEKPFHCELCDGEFRDLCQRNDHIRRHHTVEKPYSCDYCEYSSVTKDELKKHGKTHTVVENDFQPCDVCGKLYRSNLAVKIHKKRVHSSSEIRNRYKCDECEKGFFILAELRSHKQMHENEKKLLRCTFCGDSRKFKTEGGLLQHLHEHTGERLVCNICRKEFLDRRNYKFHMIIHKRNK